MNIAYLTSRTPFASSSFASQAFWLSVLIYSFLTSGSLADIQRQLLILLLQLLQAVRDHKQECTDISGLDYTLLAKLLGELGYLIQRQAPQVVCHCKTKQKSHKCLEKLTHTYLLCLSPLHPHQQVVLSVTQDLLYNDTNLDQSRSNQPLCKVKITLKEGTPEGAPVIQADLIIEPRLREQFEIAHPTEPYRRLLEHVPGEFVGTGARLRMIVEAVSVAMAEAFRAQDMSLPPWRRSSAALSKWNLVSILRQASYYKLILTDVLDGSCNLVSCSY